MSVTLSSDMVAAMSVVCPRPEELKLHLATIMTGQLPVLPFRREGRHALQALCVLARKLPPPGGFMYLGTVEIKSVPSRWEGDE